MIQKLLDFLRRMLKIQSPSRYVPATDDKPYQERHTECDVCWCLPDCIEKGYAVECTTINDFHAHYVRLPHIECISDSNGECWWKNNPYLQNQLNILNESED